MKNNFILLLTLFCLILSNYCYSDSYFDKYKKDNIEKNKQETINPISNVQEEKTVERTGPLDSNNDDNYNGKPLTKDDINDEYEEEIDSSKMTSLSYFLNSLTFTIIFGCVGARNLVYFLVLALLFIVMFQCILDIVLMGIFFGFPLAIILRKVFKC